MQREFDEILTHICEGDPRYQPEAYAFLLEALAFTQKKFKHPRHVTGKELLDGVRILLMDQFGPMTLSVLRHWGIQKTEDFGNIVFNLVEKRVLSKTEEDNIESFRDVYDFNIVFDKGYRKNLERTISRLR